MSLVLFTTETFVRELDWQLVAAAKLAQLGRTSVLGKLAALTTVARASSEGGLVVGRVFEPAFPSPDLANLHLFHGRGFSFLHLDEEGAVFQGDHERWRRVLSRRLDASVLKASDAIATWGRFQAQHYEASAPSGARVEVTGHPRFDLYLPPYREVWSDAIERVKKSAGSNYVLVNSNVSLANHGQGLAYAFSKRAGFDPEDAEKRRDHLEYWVYANRVLTGLVKVAHRIAAERPDLTVVVRPHPSESIAFYQTILGGVSNVLVTREEPVGAWLANATAVIQHGCTTAMEAAIGGIPVINYRVAVDRRYDKALPDSVGVPCQTEDDVLAALSDCSRTRVPVEPWASELFSNLSAPSFPRLIELVESMSTGGPSGLLRHELRVRRSKENLQDSVRRQVGRLSPKRRAMRAYSNAKFPGFTPALMREKGGVLKRLFGASPSLELLDRDLIVVSP